MTLSPKHLELHDVYRVIIKCALLLLPFPILQLAELFVFPIDLFTFRVWEAALAEPYNYPGPFYPNLYVKKDREFGDRYRLGGANMGEKKSVEWYIDTYGWRNRPEIEKSDQYDIVVLGDSNIVGSFLDQKDTLSETLSSRERLIAYSYSFGSRHVTPFFSDPRIKVKAPKLVVSESKVGNWDTNNSYLANFYETPDGSLDVIDIGQDFVTGPYSLPHNLFFERLYSRLSKQPMFHYAKSELRVDFTRTLNARSDFIVGKINKPGAEENSGWHVDNWVVEGGVFEPLQHEHKPAFSLRSVGSNSYWHTGKFISKSSDGNIVVRFDARNTITPSRHRAYIFENGSYRSVGEILTDRNWRTFEIPISTSPGNLLELQIDQLDTWQSLSIRDVQVMGGGSLPFLITKPPIHIHMSAWGSDSSACAEDSAGLQDCRQWVVSTTSNGYVQSPVLPQAGEGGLLIRFEVRTDQPASAFSRIYLFEGDKYRGVAQYAFDSEWREFSLLLNPNNSAPLKVQVDFPGSVGAIAIRNFIATPVERIGAPRSNHVVQ